MENQDLLKNPISKLGLSARSTNILCRYGGKKTVEDILVLDANGLLNIKQIGTKSFEEIVDKMEELGFDEYTRNIRKKIKEQQKNEIIFLRHMQSFSNGVPSIMELRSFLC